MMTPRRLNCNLIFDGEALWEAIEADLQDDPRLTVGEIAASLGVTRPYLYKLRAFTDGRSEPGGRVSECIRRRYPRARVWREREETENNNDPADSPQDAPTDSEEVA
ncbi:MAG: hypothetical protein ACYC6A_20810 [Armatimonadota bacterium]